MAAYTMVTLFSEGHHTWQSAESLVRKVPWIPIDLVLSKLTVHHLMFVLVVVVVEYDSLLRIAV